MRRRFNGYTGILIVMIWMGFQMHAVPDALGALVEDLCDPQIPYEIVIESLVEETEATGMPESTLNRLLVVGHRDPGTTEDIRRLLCVIVKAEEDGLPPGMLFRKLEEGLGKRVPLPRILNVIEKKIDDLNFARSLLAQGEDPLIDDPLVERVAKVLSLGVSKAEVTELFGPAFAAPQSMRVVGAEILGYGRNIDFASPLIEQVVASGLKSQSFTSEWIYFIKVISEARKQKIPDSVIADTAIQVLEENGSLEELVGELGLTERKLARGDVD